MKHPLTGDELVAEWQRIKKLNQALKAVLEEPPLCYLCHEPLTVIEAGAHDFCLGKMGDGL